MADAAMADAAVAEAPARPLPPEFDVLVVVLTVQAHLFNALYLITRPDIYHSQAAAIALWTVSLTVPLCCLATARRAGGVLSARAFLIAGAIMMLVVDLGLILDTERSQLGDTAVWQWGAVGVSILTLAPFRPPRDILALAMVHAGLAAASLVIAIGQPTVTPYRAVLDLGAALLPAFAAAQYVQLYGRALRLRDRAVATELQARTQAEAARAVQEDSRYRLGALRDAAVRLLSGVRDGDDPRTPQVVAEAQRLSDAVRSELVEARSGAWLLDRPRRRREGTGRDGWPGLILLDPDRLLGQLGGEDRASLAAVIEALADVGEWRRISVVLVRDDERDDRLDQATVAVVAGGPAAARALDDAVLSACVRSWGATGDPEEEGLITIERVVRLTPAGAALADLPEQAAALLTEELAGPR
jgi:FtsH-binding integral membrane protein